MKSSLYDILQIGEKASPAEITSAYHARKSRLLDAGDQDSRDELTLVHQAFEILSDQSQRTGYDQRLHSLTTSGNAGYPQSEAQSNEGMRGITKLFVLLTLGVLGYMAYQKMYPAPRPNNAIKSASLEIQAEELQPAAVAPRLEDASQQLAQRPQQLSSVESAKSPIESPTPEPTAPQAETRPPAPAVTPSSPPALRTGLNDVNDVNSVPLPNPTNQRRAYYDFLSKSNPRAFLICNDNSVMVFNGNSNFINNKLAELSSRCTPYAIDDAVVWSR